jgi:UDP-galactopyranose mutase
MKRVLVVGAGFSGAVVARELAEAGWASLVIDERDHIGGNCHTARESSTGVMVHQYGPHIFHTDNPKVWDYVRKFGEFMPFTNRVKVSIDSGIYSFPINLHTINQFFGVKLSPQQAREFVAGKAEKSIVEPANFEEQALKMIGEELYRAFFWGYTKKQWGCDPRELPAAILKRLPLRFNYDDNYYTSPYQGMPKDGYTAIVRQVLDHPLISVSLGTRFEHSMMGEFSHVFYSGPLDAFYRHRFGGLGYRTVFWDRIEASGDYQGNAVINYPGSEVPYTRIHEHKHFAPWENHERTAVFVERSKETERADTPYYPKRLPRDMEILQQYRALAGQEQSVTFVGRLATYRYMDMHHVIAEALDVAAEWLAARSRNERAPVMHPAALR